MLTQLFLFCLPGAQSNDVLSVNVMKVFKHKYNVGQGMGFGSYICRPGVNPPPPQTNKKSRERYSTSLADTTTTMGTIAIPTQQARLRLLLGGINEEVGQALGSTSPDSVRLLSSLLITAYGVQATDKLSPAIPGPWISSLLPTRVPSFSKNPSPCFYKHRAMSSTQME